MKGRQHKKNKREKKEGSEKIQVRNNKRDTGDDKDTKKEGNYSEKQDDSDNKKM